MRAPAPGDKGARRHLVRWIVLGAVAVVVAMGILFVRDALAARDSFTAIMGDLPGVEQALLEGDTEQFDDVVTDLQQETATARASTDGPLWWLAGKVPVVGANAAALTVASEVIDDVAVDVLPQLAEATAVLGDGGLQFADSQIDLDPIREAGVALDAAYPTIVEADDKLQSIDPANLVGQLADPVANATSRVSELRTLVTSGRDLTTLLPPMLGGDGPRQYLVLAQNNAELRSTGGIPGAVMLISADDGVIELVRTVPSSEVGGFDEPVLELSPEDQALYGDDMARFVQDVTLTPDFPVGAEIAAEMWRQSQGEEVDGVLAVDPVALSYLLDPIGSVEVQGWTLDADNVVDVLLSEVYAVYPDPADSDAVFAGVAAAVMDSVLGGQVDGGDLLEVVTRATDEHRILLWSARPDEQEVLAGGPLDSDLVTASDVAGIFFNDGTRGKMSYYLDSEITFVSSACTEAGRVDTFELRLSSTLPESSAVTLPRYVTGSKLTTEPLGTVRTNVSLYSAVGGQVINIVRDDVPIGGQFFENDGRAVTVITQDLAPQESVTFRMDFLAAPDEVTGVTELWSTPTASAPGIQQYDTTYC